MHARDLVLSRAGGQVMWQVGSRGQSWSKGGRWMCDNGHVRCKVGIAVLGRMCGNRELGGEPGSFAAVYNSSQSRNHWFRGSGFFNLRGNSRDPNSDPDSSAQDTAMSSQTI